MRWLLKGCAVLCASALLFGMLGGHPAAHTVSLGQVFFATGCLLFAWAFRRLWVRLAIVVAAVWAGLGWLIHVAGNSETPGLRIYSKNLWFANAEIPALVADISAADVDLVLLQEVSTRNRHVLALLRETFPHQHLCRFSAWSAIAVVSRTPFARDGVCSHRRALALAHVNVGGQLVAVGSVHVPWPWPYDADEGFDAIERVLQETDAPIVLAGDFNALPWTQGMSRMVRAANGKLAKPLRPTLRLRGIPLILDMAITPKGGHVTYRPLLGSDHAGLVVDVPHL